MIVAFEIESETGPINLYYVYDGSKSKEDVEDDIAQCIVNTISKVYPTLKKVKDYANLTSMISIDEFDINMKKFGYKPIYFDNIIVLSNTSYVDFKSNKLKNAKGNQTSIERKLSELIEETFSNK